MYQSDGKFWFVVEETMRWF